MSDDWLTQVKARLKAADGFEVTIKNTGPEATNFVEYAWDDLDKAMRIIECYERALARIETHDGHRHSEDTDEIAHFALAEAAKIKEEK